MYGKNPAEEPETKVNVKEAMKELDSYLMIILAAVSLFSMIIFI